MKISEMKDEQALEVLAEIVEPFAEIFADKEVSAAFKSGVAIKGIKPMIKNHKEAVMTILAALDGVPLKEYHCNVMTLPVKLLEIFNDPVMQEFFTSQAQVSKVSEPSGPASAATMARVK